MNTLEALKEARALIADPAHWCMHEHARGAAGESLRPSDANAVCFCTDGALARVTGVQIDEEGEWIVQPLSYTVASQVLRDTAAKLFDIGSYVEINDGAAQPDEDMTDDALEAGAHADVMRLLDTAIAALENA